MKHRTRGNADNRQADKRHVRIESLPEASEVRSAQYMCIGTCQEWPSPPDARAVLRLGLADLARRAHPFCLVEQHHDHGN